MPLERPVATGQAGEGDEGSGPLDRAGFGGDAEPAPFWRGPAGSSSASASGRGPGAASPQRQLLRRFALLVGAIALLWLLVMLVGGDAGALAIFRARNRLTDLEARVRALESENAKLREEVQRLEHDDRATERIAREELMMARPGEEVILVPDPKAVPSATPRPASGPASDPASGLDPR